MKKKITPIVLLISVMLSSCSIPHYYYSSNVQNVPLFKKKNEFTGMVAGSIGVENQFVELQAGYALPWHIAIMANYYTGGKDKSETTYTDYSRNQYIEPALGYYTSLNDFIVFEVFGGYGMGSESHVFAANQQTGGSWQWGPDGSADLSFSKLFLQPEIGIRKDWIEAAFSARVSKLYFTDINIQTTGTHLDELILLKQINSPLLFEPALTFRVGGRSVKGQMQLGLSQNLTNSSLRFEHVRFSIGVHVNFGGKQVEKNPPVSMLRQ